MYLVLSLESAGLRILLPISEGAGLRSLLLSGILTKKEQPGKSRNQLRADMLCAPEPQVMSVDS